MKYYYNISIIILLLASPLIASDITLPVISNEVRNLAKESTSNARTKAVNLKKPVASENLQKKINAIVKGAKQQIDHQTKNVQTMLDKTIRNANWKIKQAQLIRSFNKDHDKDHDTKKKEKQMVSGHRLYLFVSSSMPIDKMRVYAKQLQKYPNAQMIMRGFIGGARKMQPTMAYIKSIIVKNKDCNIGVACKTVKTKINIDPVLFQRYNITKVPTLVYVDELSGASYCSEGNTDIVNATGVHKFSGLAPLKYMLSELSNETNISKLKTLSEL